MKSSTNPKLKIGLVLDDSLDRSQNGVQQYVQSLGAWLLAQGHTVHYLVGQTQSSDESVHSLSRNIAVRFNKNRLSIPLPANKKRIQQLLADEQYDVLHVQMPYSPMLAGRVIAAAPPKTAVMGTFHILPFGKTQQYASKLLSSVQRRSLQRFDAICSVSSAAQSFADSHFGITSQVIPNMIDVRRFVSTYNIKPRRVVFLGRLVPRKGCKEFLEAVHALPPKLLSGLEVIVASDGPQRAQLEAYVQKHDLPVTFVGFVSESQKTELLATSQLAVFPSLGGESFGIVLIEAMAAGAGMVIGGNNPGYASVLGEWPDVLVDPRDAKGFAHTLQRFIEDTEAHASIHAEQQKAVKQYDTNVVGAQILDLYKTARLHRLKEMR